MNKDDQIYLFLIILSIPLGLIFRRNNFVPAKKAFLSTFIGISIVLSVSSYDIIHSLVVVCVNNAILIFFHPRHVHKLSFIWCFGYLLFFRLTHLFGLPKPIAHANAVQLLLTLKAVGVSFEVHDSYKRSESIKIPAKIDTENLNKLKLEIEFLSIDTKLSFSKLFGYCYCYIGVLTGPYFKYRTYNDWLHFKHENSIDHTRLMFKRGNTLPFIMIGYLVLSQIVSFKDPLDDKFYDSTLAYRLIFMTLVFTLFRFRFYFAWILAEFSCYTAAFGVYPSISNPKPGAGPTNLDGLKSFVFNPNESEAFSFNTIKSIDEYSVETASTVKEVLHYWNMTVQYWMANNVYRRTPIILKKLGQPITMAVSAFWHGIHPGYYLGMISTSPCILAESLMNKEFKKRYINPKYYKNYDNLMNVLFRARQFDYMSIGFILLSYEATIKYWKSVYFIGHVVCGLIISFGFLLKTLKKKKSEN